MNQFGIFFGSMLWGSASFDILAGGYLREKVTRGGRKRIVLVADTR